MSIELSKIQNPVLLFYNDNTERIPIKGLYKHGPFSRDRINEIQLDVISIRARNLNQKQINNFLNDLKRRLRELFRVNTYYQILVAVDFKDALRFERYIDAVSKKINELRKKDDKKPHVVLQILPFRDTWRDSVYNHLRLQCLTKRQDFVRALPVQSVTLERVRQSQRNKAIIENLALGIYVKAGGVPWQIKGNISNIFNNTLYVGYDISRKDDKESVGSIVVYDNSGQLVYYRDFTVTPKHQKDIISESEFYSFLVYLINDARDNQHEVETLVIHRDGGNFPQEELRALENVYHKLKVDYVALAFSKMSFFPLLKVNGKDVEIADSGSYFMIGSEFVGDKKIPTILMQTLGNELPIARAMTPNLLKVMFFAASRGIYDKYSGEELFQEFAKETFYLSRLNWSTKFGFAKLPVTIHYAHKTSQLLRLGLQIGNLDRRKLWML